MAYLDTMQNIVSDLYSTFPLDFLIKKSFFNVFFGYSNIWRLKSARCLINHERLMTTLMKQNLDRWLIK